MKALNFRPLTCSIQAHHQESLAVPPHDHSGTVRESSPHLPGVRYLIIHEPGPEIHNVHGYDTAVEPQVLNNKIRGPEEHINIRILQTMISSIPLIFGLSTRMSDPYVYVVFWAPKDIWTLWNPPALQVSSLESLAWGRIPRSRLRERAGIEAASGSQSGNLKPMKRSSGLLYVLLQPDLVQT